MSKFVIQQVVSKMFMGELSPNGKNSMVTRKAADAKKFETEDEAQKHIKLCIKKDAGITSARNVRIIPA